MLKKTITYLDFNDNERTEDFYFNFTEAEVAELELGTVGGLTQQIKELISSQNQPEIVSIFKKLVLQAYGKKSPDGVRFIKSEELSKEFSETRAYSQLFMSLATNAEEAANFFKGIIPTSASTTGNVVNITSNN